RAEVLALDARGACGPRQSGPLSAGFFVIVTACRPTMAARFVPSMKKRLLPLLLLCALACGVVQAEKADRNKPMNIEADALRHDELQQTSVFTGNVVMTKGTIVLRGAQLDVRQDAEGYQFGTVTAEPGKRAFFRQKRDTLAGQPDEFVEGEAEVIEYDGKA